MQPWSVYVFPVSGTWLFGNPWIVSVRVKGKVQTLQPGQVHWSPLWRSRILNTNDMVMVLEDSACVLKGVNYEQRFGPRSVIVLEEAQDYRGTWQVFVQDHWPKIQTRLQRALGKQSRFEVKQPGGAIAARG
jgi:hypothetical protein